MIMVKVSPAKSQGYGQDKIKIMAKIRSRLWSRLVPQKVKIMAKIWSRLWSRLVPQKSQGQGLYQCVSKGQDQGQSLWLSSGRPWKKVEFKVMVKAIP